MKNNQDQIIINNCLKGDQKAYKQLYDNYKGYCFAIALRYGFEKDEIKDVLQIIFSEAFKSLRKFDSERSSFKTWLSRIAINQILKIKRKNRVTATVDFSNFEYEIQEDRFIEGNLDKKLIIQALSKMPDELSIIFNLAIMDGFSHKEIAEKLNITQANSRVKLNRARNWAKQVIETYLKI